MTPHEPPEDRYDQLVEHEPVADDIARRDSTPVLSAVAGQVAEVLAFPARRFGEVTATTVGAPLGALRRMFADEVDDWGRDDGLASRVWLASRARWDVSVGGVEHVPRRRAALIVVNARRFALAPLFAALAIGAEIGRPVRFVGRPDVAPVGPMMQRLGALLPLPAELEGVLRSGELVVLGTSPHLSNRRAGDVDHRLIGAAVATQTRVLPAATVSEPFRRAARVEIGSPIRSTRRRRGPLDELELAAAVRARIDGVLTELGGTVTGTPLDWLPFGGMGAL